MGAPIEVESTLQNLGRESVTTFTLVRTMNVRFTLHRPAYSKEPYCQIDGAPVLAYGLSLRSRQSRMQSQQPSALGIANECGAPRGCSLQHDACIFAMYWLV